MGSLQQIFVGAVCVGGAFLMGHYLNNQKPSSTPFEKNEAASAPAEGQTPDPKASTALLPNFRTQSKLGIDFDKEADLPPPSQLETPAVVDSKQNASGTPSRTESNSEPEMDIEVPDFSSLAAQFKGTALELPSLDSAPPAPSANEFNRAPKDSKALTETVLSKEPFGSGLTQNPSLDYKNQNEPSVDGAVLIPQFKTSINPLEGMENAKPAPALNAQAVLPSAETSFREEDFAPKLRSDSGFGEPAESNQHQDPFLVDLRMTQPEIQPPVSPLADNSSNTNSVLEVAQPSSLANSRPVIPKAAHPNAIVSYNDPFPTELAPTNLNSAMTETQSPARNDTNRPEAQIGSNQWLARDQNRNAVAVSPTNRRDSLIPESPNDSSRDMSSGLGKEDLSRWSRLNLATHSAANSTATRFEEYQTRKGDTLQAISNKFYGTPEYYLDIYLTNRKQLRNPSDVPAGIVLRIPIYE